MVTSLKDAIGSVTGTDVYVPDPFMDRAAIEGVERDGGCYWLGKNPPDAWVARQSHIPVNPAMLSDGASIFKGNGVLLKWQPTDDQEDNERVVWSTALAFNRSRLSTFGDGAGCIVNGTARVVEELDIIDDIGGSRNNWRRSSSDALMEYATAPMLIISNAGMADPYASTLKTWFNLLRACMARNTKVAVTSFMPMGVFCDKFRDKVSEERVDQLKSLMDRMTYRSSTAWKIPDRFTTV